MGTGRYLFVFQFQTEEPEPLDGSGDAIRSGESIMNSFHRERVISELETNQIVGRLVRSDSIVDVEPTASSRGDWKGRCDGVRIFTRLFGRRPRLLATYKE